MRTEQSLEPGAFSLVVAMPRPDGEIVTGDATPRRKGERGAKICHASMAPDFDVLCMAITQGAE